MALSSIFFMIAPRASLSGSSQSPAQSVFSAKPIVQRDRNPEPTVPLPSNVLRKFCSVILPMKLTLTSVTSNLLFVREPDAELLESNISKNSVDSVLFSIF